MFIREINFPETLEPENKAPIFYARKVKKKKSQSAMPKISWNKGGKINQCMENNPKRVHKKDVDHQMSNEWLKTAGLKLKQRAFYHCCPRPSHVQDPAIKTNYYRGKILKDGTDPMCRICGQFQETIDHIVEGCPELTKTEYLHRQNKASRHTYSGTSAKRWT